MSRRDRWRFWASSRAAAPYTRRAVSLTLTAGGREWTIGYRRKGWVA